MKIKSSPTRRRVILLDRAATPAAPRVLGAVRREVARRVPRTRRAVVQRWAGLLLGETSEASLADFETEALVGIAVSSFQLLLKRHAGERIVRVMEGRIFILQDDHDFIVRSLREFLLGKGIHISLLLHPQFSATRRADGALERLASLSGRGTPESFVWIETDRPRLPETLEAEITRLMQDIERVTVDFPALRDRLAETAALLRVRSGDASEEAREADAFLRWLHAGNFILLGCRDYSLAKKGRSMVFRAVPGTGLGLLARESRALETVPEDERDAVTSGPLLSFAKTRETTSIYRAGRMSLLRLRIVDHRGRTTGERRFVGLIADKANHASKIEIPILRLKFERIREAFHAARGSFDDREIANLFSNLPADRLLAARTDDLVREFALTLRGADIETPKAAARYDAALGGVAVTVVMPQERYRPDLEERIVAALRPRIRFTDVETRVIADPARGGRVRVHLFLSTRERPAGVERLAEIVLKAIGSWTEELEAELRRRLGARAEDLRDRYARSFDETYQVIVEPALAANDIADLERIPVGADGATFISWGRPSSDGLASYLKIFRRGAKVAISEIAPVLVHFAFEIEDENSFEIRLGGGTVHLHVFRLKTEAKRIFTNATLGGRALCSAIADALAGTIEHDALNGLMTTSDLDLRTTALMRCYRNYARQIAAISARQTANITLLRHPKAVRLLAQLFAERLDPARADKAAARRSAKAFDVYLAGVQSIEEDRILRVFRNLVESTLRTSFYRPANPELPPDAVAIKIDCAAIDKMPAPRPWREIYVYGGASMEGAHLRGGPVARGGLRWSERPDDFRTEVLGLVKTQITKNAQIVPTGAKGCFIVKRLPAPGAGHPGEEIRRCYRILVRSFLEMQDNIVKGRIVRPARVVAHDGDDPYLVVAADKGTATFSDTANALSAEYGFWLADAFASGGSNGYDHKKEAITATGAWVSVERHFRDLGIDIRKKPFTAVGVGDMSGDVFGNGALLSDKLCLVAAFDWRDIFIDPNPDPARSFAERRRLFALPRSSWQDYRREEISRGGGVFSRSMKRIPLSEEARRALGVEAKELDPDSLVRAILTAPVDLLYNGGIGTYVKASYQVNAEVGDPQNDALRVDASALRCRVVGEGGNLGFTQEARIEFALRDASLRGGRIFTDAMDNSGGVDLSDHEVNLKVLIDGDTMSSRASGAQDGALRRRGSAKRMTPAERTRLLKRFKAPIVRDVLKNNYLQTLAVSLDEIRSRRNLPLFGRTVADLERRGLMNAALEGLPDADTLRDRASAEKGFVAPELCVLLAWAKIDMKARILDSPLVKSPQMTRYMKSFFAPEIREHFGEGVTRHRLKDQILVTAITNSVVNLHGAAALNKMTTDLGLAASRVVEGLLVAREILGVDEILESLFALDGRIPSSIQYEEILGAEEAVALAARWLIRNVPDLRNKLEEAIATYANLHARCLPSMRRDLPASDRAAFAAAERRRVAAGIPAATAERLALLEHVPTVLDAVRLANAGRLPLRRAMAILYEVGDRLRLGTIIEGLKSLPRKSDWDGSAMADVVAELRRSRRRIAEKLIALGVSIDRFMETRHRSSAALIASIARIENEKPATIAPYVVVSNQIQNLAAL